MSDSATARWSNASRPVVHDEDLETFVGRMAQIVDEQKQLLRRASKPGRLYLRSPNKPDIRLLLEKELLERLRDEVVPAVATTEEGIRPDEVTEEVIKRALMGLKAEGMRRIARSKNLPLSGGSEELATRIARSVNWNGTEVAELVLRNAPPDEERSYADRLYPLSSPASLDEVRQPLEFVLGRYIRVGVARWFVFERLEQDDLGLHISGTLRAWDAYVSETGAEVDVVPVERRKTLHPLRLTVDESSILRVSGGNLAEAKAAVTALTLVAPVGPVASVSPDTAGIMEGAAVTFAPESLFLLDLLQARFKQYDLITQNLTVARFRVGLAAADESGWRRPTLRAVRFEGEYLFDSPPACKLLANEGRALVDVSLNMRSATSAPGIETSTFPVRIALDDDHVLILTGFGSTPSLAHAAHERIRQAVRDEMKDGILDARAVERLADRIEVNAQATAPAATAEILVDPDDEGLAVDGDEDLID